jgi:hypothetical protein
VCVRKRDDAETLLVSLVARDFILVAVRPGGCRERLRLTDALRLAVAVDEVPPRDTVWKRLAEVDEGALLQFCSADRSTELPVT